MSYKIEVNNLVKIFGSRPDMALDRLNRGWTKKQILDETGQTIGVNNVSFNVKEG